MKRVFTITVLIFAVIAIGLFVFVLTFNANKYKPLLIEKIEKAIKKDVKIANISLALFPPVTIRMNGVSVKDSDRVWDEAGIKAGSLTAVIKPLPLIRKDVQIESLTTRGLTVNLANLGIAPSLDFDVDVIEADFKNISLYGPIYVNARLSLFGKGMKDVNLKAHLYPGLETKSPYIKNLELKIDLNRLDLTAVLNALGEKGLSERFTGKEVSGNLLISSERVFLDPKRFYDSDLYVDLSKGATDIVPGKNGINNVILRARMVKRDIIIERFKGRISGGEFSIKGKLKDIAFGQRMDIEATLKDIQLAGLLPAALPDKPYLEGIADMDMVSSARGLTPEKIMDTLTAKGGIGLDKVVLNNMNILALALGKLNILPGLVERLKAKLPNRYKDLLKQDYTTFRPLKTRFVFEDKGLFFPKFLIVSDAFYLSGKGSLDMDGNIEIYSSLFIPKDLSLSFIDVVPELRYLENREGMITMPLKIYGRFPDISVTPDIDYVIRKLAVSKGQELIQRIFQKEGPKKAGGEITDKASESGGRTQQQQGQPEKIKPEEAIIKTIFDIISSPKK